MKSKRREWVATVAMLFILALACNTTSLGETIVPTLISATSPLTINTPILSPSLRKEATATSLLGSNPGTPTVEIVHLMRPANLPNAGKLIYDVQSQNTALEKRAPYGDSYSIGRFERPFLQDMTYISDLDIYTFDVSLDDNW